MHSSVCPRALTHCRVSSDDRHHTEASEPWIYRRSELFAQNISYFSPESQLLRNITWQAVKEEEEEEDVKPLINLAWSRATYVCTYSYTAVVVSALLHFFWRQTYAFSSPSVRLIDSAAYLQPARMHFLHIPNNKHSQAREVSSVRMYEVVQQPTDRPTASPLETTQPRNSRLLAVVVSVFVAPPALLPLPPLLHFSPVFCPSCASHHSSPIHLHPLHKCKYPRSSQNCTAKQAYMYMFYEWRKKLDSVSTQAGVLSSGRSWWCNPWLWADERTFLVSVYVHSRTYDIARASRIRIDCPMKPFTSRSRPTLPSTCAWLRTGLRVVKNNSRIDSYANELKHTFQHAYVH